MPIYLIRHGETMLNATRVLQPPDTPLSEEGFAQAQALGKRLKSTAVDGIVSSDLLRALQTSQAIVAEREPGHVVPLKLHTSSLLQERNLGDYRGQPYAVIGVDLLDFKEAPPGGESLDDFEARVDEAFEHIVDVHQDLADEVGVPDPVLLVVSHGLVIRRIIEAYLSLSSEEIVPDRIANTSVTIFDALPPHLVELLNCSTHLLDAQSPHHRPAFGG
jgi:2,3-bisphosphoglycerate-dependent phosphoglycerate mutase